MDNEFHKQAYESHVKLFTHYSGLVFRARVAMITLILLVFGYLFGTVAGAGDTHRDLLGIGTKSAMAYLAALLLSLLFSMENAYLRRLVARTGQ